MILMHKRIVEIEQSFCVSSPSFPDYSHLILALFVTIKYPILVHRYQTNSRPYFDVTIFPALVLLSSPHPTNPTAHPPGSSPEPTLPLGIMLPHLLWSVTISQSFLVFPDLGSFEEYWLGIL